MGSSSWLLPVGPCSQQPSGVRITSLSIATVSFQNCNATTIRIAPKLISSVTGTANYDPCESLEPGATRTVWGTPLNSPVKDFKYC
jgi:hypothetical protein